MLVKRYIATDEIRFTESKQNTIDFTKSDNAMAGSPCTCIIYIHIYNIHGTRFRVHEEFINCDVYQPG